MGVAGSKSAAAFAGGGGGGGKVSAVKDVGFLKKETAIFARWTIKDVRQMHNVFRKQVHGFAIVATQFETLMGIKPEVSAYVDIQTLFEVLDNDNDGRIDGLEFLGGVGLICRGSLEDKARFCFELYDFNLNSSLSLQEMVVMMQSSVCGMLCLTGGLEDHEPELSDFEQLGLEAFKNADGNSDGNITFDEFLKWARTSRDIMEYLDKIARTAEQGLEDADTDDSASDVSEDCAPEMFEIWPQPMSTPESEANTTAALTTIASAYEQIEDESLHSTLMEAASVYEMHGLRFPTSEGEQPDSNLDLEYVHGYSCCSSRNSVFFAATTGRATDRSLATPSGERMGASIVYPAASIGVVQNISDGSQLFYQGHRSALSSIAMHPSGGIVATADIGRLPSIHVWSVDELSCMSYLVGFHQDPVSCLKFSPDGKELASISCSPERAIAIYNWRKGDVTSSGHISSAAVYDAAFSPPDQNSIVVVGDQFIKFAQLGGRALKFRNGILRGGRKRQKFICVTYVGPNAVVGCASGELYRFQGRWCIQSIQAHSVCEPVLSLHWSDADAILVTGGRDGLLKTWDSDLHEVGEGCDISVDADGDGSNDTGVLKPNVVSVCIQGSTVVVGTRSSDILLVELPTTKGESLALRRLVWAHEVGHVAALATHPFKQEFATGGADHTVRIWSSRSSQMTFRRLPEACTAVAYHPRGSTLVIGLKNGAVSLLDAQSARLRTFCSWQHSTEAIVDAQFSPNGNLVAVASSAGDIFIYALANDFRSVRRQALCKTLPAPTAQIDFSSDSQYLRCDSVGYELKAWTVTGRSISDPTTVSNVHWRSWRCRRGWHMAGSIADHTAAEAHPDIGVVATGNLSGEVSLYRFPLLSRTALCLSYFGHGGPVERLAFSHDWTTLLTVGLTDGTVLQWEHMPSTDDSESDDEDYIHNDIRSFALNTPVQRPETARSRFNDSGAFAVGHEDGINSDDDTAVSLNIEVTGGDEFMAVRPWKGSIVGPSNSAPQSLIDGSSTDVDLELHWVHGYRGHDSRANLRYSADGSIVYPAAALAVAYNKGTNSQRFLQNKHTDDVLSLSLHPNGNLAATGEIGKSPKILVWNTTTMQVAATLKGFHQRSVLHLAFSPEGAWLASVGGDDEHQLAIYDWARSRFVSSVPTEKRPSQTFGLCVMMAGSHAAGRETSLRTTARRSTVAFSRSSGRAGGATARPKQQKGATGTNIVVVTCGSSGVKFWTFNGSHLSCVKGKQKKGSKLMLATVAVHELADVCISSSSDGGVFYWKGFGCTASIPPQQLHSHAVTALWSSWTGEFGLLYSGDKSGRVGVSQVTDLLVPLQRFEATQFARTPLVPHIKSVCERDGKLLVGFVSNEVVEVWLPAADSSTGREGVETFEGLRFQLDERQPSTVEYIVSAHHGAKEVWALATHPTKPMFITGADDQTVRLWEYEKQHKLLGTVLAPAAVRALAVAEFRDATNAPELVNQASVCHLATALSTGVVYVLDLDQVVAATVAQTSNMVVIGIRKAATDGGASQQALTPTATLRPTKKSALPQDMKYSPNGQWLAIGYHDRNIYCYRREGLEYKGLQVLRGHNSYITHLDFGVLHTAEGDQLALQSNCGAYELLFWVLRDKPNQQTWVREPSASKLRDTDWLTWTCVLGWPVQGIWPSRADGTDINAADRNHLFSDLPVLATADDFGQVKLFNYPCVVQGAADKTYQGHSSHVTNVRFVCDDSFLVSTGGNDKCVFVWKTDVREEIRELHAAHGPPQDLGSTVRQPMMIEDVAGQFVEREEFRFEAPIGGDQFMAVKPYQDALIAPTTWVESNDCLSAPSSELELDFVYGYRSHDCRNNIGFGDEMGTIIYHVAAVGIAYDSDQHKQTRNLAHTDDIICLATHPDGHIVATGELGKKPAIVLWDSHSGMTLHTLVGFHRRGVCCLAFSDSGEYLASVGLDEDHSLAIYNCSTGHLVASGKGSRSKVYCLAYHGESDLVTVGDKHVKFWEFSAQEQSALTSKKGLGADKKCGSTTACSAAYINDDAITGMSNGQLLLWKGRNATKAVQAHSGAIWALAAARRDSLERVVSGGKDGKVAVWSSQLKCLWSFDIRETVPAPHIPEVRAVALAQDRIIVGTRSSQIYHVDMGTQEASQLVDGHFSGEVWGLDFHPRDDCVVTCGDDATVRLWDTSARALCQTWKVNNKARAVCFSPDAAYVAVGLYSGHVQVLTGTLDREIFSVKVAQNWIQTIKYSPDGRLIAVGGHDRIVYVLNAGNGGRRFILQGHSSYITHLDFSADSNFLQSTSGAYEMFFWDLTTGKRVMSATRMRDTNWQSWTCPIGWPVQGIWQRGMDGTDINAVARSASRALLVSGDDFGKVRLFRYPAPRENTASRAYSGHSSHVMNVSFSRDDRSVFSVGGLDHALMQFKVRCSAAKQR